MREIIEAPSFKDAVETLGGHRAIDEVLEPLLESLYLNPYGFQRFENDWTSFHYARTKEVAFTPALIFIFTIDANHNVVLEHVEEDPDAT